MIIFISLQSNTIELCTYIQNIAIILKNTYIHNTHAITWCLLYFLIDFKVIPNFLDVTVGKS